MFAEPAPNGTEHFGRGDILMKHLIDTLRGRHPDPGHVTLLTVVAGCCLLGFVVLVLFAL